jgi:hypothetical protein
MYRDDNHGDIIVEKPIKQITPKLSISLNSPDLHKNAKSSSSSSVHSENQHKLAAFIGPVSPTIVKIKKK